MKIYMVSLFHTATINNKWNKHKYIHHYMHISQNTLKHADKESNLTASAES